MTETGRTRGRALLNAQLTRVLRGYRRWRSDERDPAIVVDPGLTDGDWKRLATEIDATVGRKGGPVAARRRARVIGLTYETLDADGRLRFLRNLAAEFDRDEAAIDQAIDRVLDAGDREARRVAEDELRATLEPPRHVLLDRLAGMDGGLPFLIEVRADLLPHRATSPELGTLDADLRQVLEGWFDVGLLRLERLTWDTPASFLEKLIEYEAVHAIESWDDLRNRLGPGRRCYAFVHPGMPDDPLIFVEVALTGEISRHLAPLLSLDRDEDHLEDESGYGTAIFYSISNCHAGLAGISLGDFLIKSVVEELSAELSGLKTFATLSPMPGFRGWLQQRAKAGEALTTPGEAEAIGLGPAEAEDRLVGLVDGPFPGGAGGEIPPELEELEPTITRLAADYLLGARRSGRAYDPVAHFHLSNGARVEQLNWLANPSPVGWDRGLGMMVNYRYDLKTIERNHDAYVNTGEVAAADPIRKLADGSRS